MDFDDMFFGCIPRELIDLDNDGKIDFSEAFTAASVYGDLLPGGIFDAFRTDDDEDDDYDEDAGDD